MDHDTLLRHAGFLRTLARSLVHDDETADDVVQDTWIKALTDGPTRPGSVRPWLARVTANFALRSRRSKMRRDQYERAAPTASAPPTPDELFERETLIRAVVDAVFALPEPYKSAIMARYYEGLRFREIAQRTGENEATIRTRVRRGLGLLRERLDDECGDRTRWKSACGMLVAASAPATAAAGLGGALLLGTIVLIGGGALAWQLTRNGGGSTAGTGERARIEAAMKEAASLPPGAPPVTIGPKPGQAAPPLTLSALLQAPDGQSTDWRAFRGRFVVLGFWSEFCDESPGMLARLEQIARRFPDRVRCLAITSDSEATARDYLAMFPSDAWVGVDAKSATFRAFGVLMLPTIFVIDGESRIRHILPLKDATPARIDEALRG